MLSCVEVFIETFAIALSVVCSCAEVPGNPPQWCLPRNGHLRRETTFLKKVCVETEEGESCHPCPQYIPSSRSCNLTIGDLWEADFCFWAGEVKSESGKCRTEACGYTLYGKCTARPLLLRKIRSAVYGGTADLLMYRKIKATWTYEICSTTNMLLVQQPYLVLQLSRWC